jgi:DNA-binding SARP family transcriptional activator
MDFALLGPLEVWAGDGPLALGPPKQRALLALLLLSANRVVSRERLIDGLWGDDPPETAVKSVQVYVSRLRKLLPEGMLLTRAPGYLLAVGDDALDLGRFERLVEEARAARPQQAAVLLRGALGLWRGPALAEFDDEPFARFEAARLDELRFGALERRIEADLALGRHSELVGELQSLAGEHPRRERLRAQLMLALYRSGRQTEALAGYRDARAALDELGLEPGEALRRLERQILAHDPAIELPAVSLAERGMLPGPLVPAPPFPFVGREHELSILRALLGQAEAGEGALVLLGGAAGMGKTRLLRELAHAAAGGGALVLYGVSDAAVTTPYQPLREWIEFLLSSGAPDVLRDSLGSQGAELVRLVPELEPITGLPPSGRDSESDRIALRRAALDLIVRLSRTQPLLLVLDDLQWADAEMLHLLRGLARKAPELRLLVLAAFRDRGERARNDVAESLADLSRRDGVSQLTLTNLGADEVRAFVRDATKVDASAELVAAIGELTGGTPLLVCELWRELRERDEIEVADTVRLTRPVGRLRAPRRLGTFVERRLARLTPEAFALVEVAAVAGPRFELHVIGGALGLDSAAMIAGVEEAIESGLVEDLPGSTPACRFTHELVRRAVYDRITSLRRAELHLRAPFGLTQGPVL